jgi:hypothetical protein
MPPNQQDTGPWSVPAPTGAGPAGGTVRPEGRREGRRRAAGGLGPGPWSRRYRWAHIALILASTIFGGTALAQASFTGVAAAPVLIGTYDIPASASLTGTYSCDSRRTLTVNVTGFGRVDRATAYTLTLAEPGANAATTTQNLTATQTSATITRSTSRTGSFTLNLVARVGTWTSDTPLTRTITC